MKKILPLIFFAFLAQSVLFAQKARIYSDKDTACTLENIVFNDDSFGGTPTTWLWTFGSDAIPTNSTDPNPGDVYWTSPGFKTVRLDVDGGGGDKTTIKIIYIRANSSNSINITTSINNFCPGTYAKLTVNGGSLGDNAQWKWYTGACGSVLIDSGSYIFVNPNVTTEYFVRAEGTCNTTDCDSITLNVKTNSIEAISLITNNNNFCVGDSAILSINGGSLGTNASWNWYRDACGINLITSNDSLTVFPNEDHTYYLRAEGDCNTTNCKSINLNVNPLPDNPVLIAGDMEVCQGQNNTLFFTNQVSNATGYTWNLPSGISVVNDNGDTIICNVSDVAVSGVISVYAQNGCGNSDTIYNTVTVNSKSIIADSISASTNNICPGDNVTLTIHGGTLGTGATWNWYKGACNGEFIGTGNTLAVNPSQTTQYFAKGTGECNTTLCVSKTIVVEELPSAISSIIGNTNVCQSQTNVLYYVSSFPNSDTLIWSLPLNASIANNYGDSVYINYATNAVSGNISVFGRNACGDGPSTSTYINLNTISSNSTNITANNNNLCPSDSSILTVNGGSLGTGAIWKWYENSCGGNYLGSGSTIEVNPSATREYFVRAEGFCNNTPCDSITINMQALPENPSNISGTSPVCQSQNSIQYSIDAIANADNYFWTLPEGFNMAMNMANTIEINASDTALDGILSVYANNNNCPSYFTDSSFFFINVNNISMMPDSITASADTICPLENVTLKVFGDSIGTGAVYQWYKDACSGTFLGSGNSIVVNPATTTTYFVKASGLCNTTNCLSIKVVVEQMPEAPASIIGVSPVCQESRDVLYYVNPVLHSDSTKWIFPGGATGISISSATKDSILFDFLPSTGDFTLYAYSYHNKCNYSSSNAAFNVKINSLSTKPTSITATTNNVCPEDTIYLIRNGGTLGTGAQWKWYKDGCGANYVGSGDTIMIMPEHSSSYYLRAEGVCNNSLCTDISITTRPLPELTEPISGISPVCVEDTAVYHVKYSNADSILWILPSEMTQLNSNGIDSLVVRFNGLTSAPIRVFAKNSCASSAISSFNVTINPLPIVVFQMPSPGVYSIDDPPIFIEENINYSPIGIGGVFTGPGIIDFERKFYPNIAGLTDTIPPHKLTYTFTTPQGCTSSVDEFVSVVEGYGKFIFTEHPFNNYCKYDNPNSIIAVPKLNVLGSFDEFSGLTDLGDNTAEITPEILDSGFHVISFSYFDTIDLIERTIVDSIYIEEINEVSISENLDDAYCINAQPVNLFGIPSGGDFYSLGNRVQEIEDNVFVFLPNQYSYGGMDTVFYTYYSARPNSVCYKTVAKGVMVNELPDVELIVPLQFCQSNEADTIIGTPSGGQYSGPNIVPLGDSAARFIPSSAGLYNLYYTYQDENTCQNTDTVEVRVHQKPEMIIINTELDNEYCRNSDTSKFRAKYRYSTLSNFVYSQNGYFMGAGISNQPDSLDATAIFYPPQAFISGGAGNFNIDLHLIDSNNCVFTQSSQIVMHDIPNAQITGFVTNHSYCEDYGTINLSCLPKLSSSNWFAWQNTLDTTAPGYNILIQSDYFEPGEAFVSYQVTDEFNCSDTITDTLFIKPVPNPDFSISDFCISNPITFNDNSSVTSPDYIVSWNWDLDDGFVSTEQNPIVDYDIEGEKYISLNVVTNSGCDNEIEREETFGGNPVADFSWFNECFSIDTTQFFDLSTPLDSPNVYIYAWDFGDNSPIFTSKNPFHTFDRVDSFNVRLQVISPNNCIDDTVKTIHIRPYIQQYDYFTDFEEHPSGWYPEITELGTTANSWMYGTPTTAIALAASGENAWFTDFYKDREKSGVISPCFDFRNLVKPMIKFNLWYNLSNGDGALLEYSYDNGVTWKGIGFVSDGINWFNTPNIVGLNERNGWSGNAGDNYLEVRHSFEDVFRRDGVYGDKLKNLRFRVSLGTNNVVVNDGIAIDDIWIGERPKMALIEHFTNEGEELKNYYNDYKDFLYINGLIVVDVQYHTNFPNSDNFYYDFQSGVNSRRILYGIDQNADIPSAILDGNQLTTKPINYLPNQSNQFAVRIQSLNDPLFLINDLEKQISGETISVSFKIEAQETLDNHEITVHTLLVEKEIEGNNFVNIVRNMLPDAGGTYFNGSWSEGQTEPIAVSGNLSNFNNSDNLRLVVFVQDEMSKEIYQVAVSDTLYSPADIDDYFANSYMDYGFAVYPNPARYFINIVFDAPLNKDLNYQIINSEGKMMDSNILMAGSKTYKIDVAGFNNGMYFIHLYSDNQWHKVQKLVKHK